MMYFDLGPLPGFMPAEFCDCIAVEQMGLRFKDENRFRNQGLIALEKIFRELAPADQEVTLAWLREAALSACALPSDIPAQEHPLPVYDIHPASRSLLKDLIAECSRQNLALPIFGVSDSRDSVFWIYQAILVSGYRGPLFLCSAEGKNPSPADRRIGILNHYPARASALDPTSLNGCLHELKRLLWFRNQILPLSEPWVKKGNEK